MNVDESIVLSIYIESTYNNSRQKVWELKGYQGDRWKRGVIPINNPDQYKVEHISVIFYDQGWVSLVGKSQTKNSDFSAH